MDWSGFALGTLETYDAYISFFQPRAADVADPAAVRLHQRAGEDVFSRSPGAGALERDKGFWARGAGIGGSMLLGPVRRCWIGVGRLMRLRFRSALVTSDYAVEGGFCRFCSPVVHA
jgi:hypothetical protein